MKSVFKPFAALFVAAFFAFSSPVFSQSLRGQILDEKGQPLEFANVFLKKGADSSLIRAELTDAFGRFVFEKLSFSTYLIGASMVGFETKMSEPFELLAEKPDREIPVFSMTELSKMLGEAVVIAQKPFLQRDIDKLVVNVAGSAISSGASAIEVLQRVPGVLIVNDQIRLNNKPGVQIFIDGRPSRYSDVTAFLRDMPSDQIEKIEVITNPGAKYDAAGSSGIINIVMKKNANLGTNGSFYLGGAYGRFGKARTGLELNHRKNGVNIFGSSYVGYRKIFEAKDLDRVVGQERFLQKTDEPSRGMNFSERLGIDWFLNEKHTLGALFTGYQSRRTSSATSKTDILNAQNATKIGSLSTIGDGWNHWDNLTGNANYRFKPDTTDLEFSVDFDWAFFGSDGGDLFDTRFFGVNNEAQGQPFLLRNEQPNSTDLKTAKADFVWPVSKTLKIEAGAKHSRAKIDADLRFEKFENNAWAVDLGQTNRFLFDENITAGYTNARFSAGKWRFQTGIRAEKTDADGRSTTTGETVKRDYLSWFPSAFASRKLTKNLSANVNYARRIDRPNYESLNPFVYFLDPFTFKKGNEKLRPQFTQGISTGLTWDDQPFFTFNYDRTTDVITAVLEQNDSTKSTFLTDQNLSDFEQYGLQLGAPLMGVKWLDGFVGAQLNYNMYDSEYLGERYLRKQFQASYFLQANFKLPKKWEAEMTGWYQGRGLDGVLTFKPLYGVSFGASKTFLDDRLKLRVSVEDLIYENFRGALDYANIDLKVVSKWERQIWRANLTYSFGNSALKASRSRKTASEEEQKRIKVN